MKVFLENLNQGIYKGNLERIKDIRESRTQQLFKDICRRKNNTYIVTQVIFS